MADDIQTTVTDGKVVHLHYELTDEDGAVLDRSDEDEPLSYLHGAGNIVPGLEAALTGRRAGDQLDVVVSPEEGYGPRDDTPAQPVPMEALPDGFEPEVGLPLLARGPDGEIFTIWITKVEEDRVFVDANHPLAGKPLHFAVEVVSVRDATDEELAHGHPHGPGGHHED